MDMNLSPEDEAFRKEVRSWIKENLPARISDKVRTGKRLVKDDYVTWQKLLNERGWLAPHWPVEYGGTGWNPVQKHIFEEEFVAASAPRLVGFGINMLGPVLIEYGSEEHKQKYLPRILSNEDWWAQGYSEPGAGSDLASLQTRAVREGDHYIVNGQKTWTTLGQFANMIFCLVRTNPDVKNQEGISFLLIDMNTPGVEVRPIILLDGEHEVNEVWFTDVRVPVANLVGEENKGWTYAKYLLTYERTGIAGVGASKKALSSLKAIAKREMHNGQSLAENPIFATRMAQVEIDLMAMEVSNLRIVSAAGEGKVPGPESSYMKIKGTEIRQELTKLLRQAAGPYAMPFVPEAFDEGYNEEPIGPEGAMAMSRQYFNFRKISIYGGSNEIQRNIIAKHLLGL